MSSFARSNRLRRGRFSEPGRIYFLTTVTHDRSPIFRDLFAARLLINELRLAHD